MTKKNDEDKYPISREGGHQMNVEPQHSGQHSHGGLGGPHRNRSWIAAPGKPHDHEGKTSRVSAYDGELHHHHDDRCLIPPAVKLAEAVQGLFDAPHPEGHHGLYAVYEGHGYMRCRLCARIIVWDKDDIYELNPHAEGCPVPKLTEALATWNEG